MYSDVFNKTIPNSFTKLKKQVLMPGWELLQQMDMSHVVSYLSCYISFITTNYKKRQIGSHAVKQSYLSLTRNHHLKPRCHGSPKKI
jgi:hypothetical protein